jgi:hypothetical protein
MTDSYNRKNYLKERKCLKKEVLKKLHKEIVKQFISELFSLFCWHITSNVLNSMVLKFFCHLWIVYKLINMLILIHYAVQFLLLPDHKMIQIP